MDENFLLYRKHLRLLELMQQHNKPWSLAVFSSGNVLKSYTIEQLVRPGNLLGLDGIGGRKQPVRKAPRSGYADSGADAPVSPAPESFGSSIIGLEDHTPDNIDRAIDYATEHETDFHGFSLYTPIAGTACKPSWPPRWSLKNPNELDAADIPRASCYLDSRHRHIPRGWKVSYWCGPFNETST